MDISRRSKLLLCFGIVYVVWGSTYLATATGVRVVPPFLFGGLRFLLGGLLLLVVARLLPSFRTPASPAEWRAASRGVLLVALTGVLISNGANSWGLQYVPSNQAALLNATVAFWVTLFGMWGARGHRPSRRAWIGVAIGLVGTALILLPHPSSGPKLPSPWGPIVPQLVILCGCMGWSAGTVLQRHIGEGFDLLTFTAVQQVCGSLLLLSLGIARGELARWHWSPEAGWALAYLAIASSCIAYTAYAWLSRNATPSRIGTYALVNPAVATALGWIVLDEKLAGMQWAGMVVILAGVLLVNLPTRVRVGSD